MTTDLRRHTRTLTMALCLATCFVGCSTLKSVADALNSLGKLQFKLGTVSDFTLGGINISTINSYQDINPVQGISLVNSVRQKQLPSSFTLNVLAKNPNDGTATKATPIFLRKLVWTLMIDDRTTITGITDRRLEIPASGQTTTIPITMSVDLMKFFGDRGFDDLMNLAFALGGKSGSSARLKLTARVTVEEPVTQRTFEYPNDITIINSQFSNP